MNKYTRSFPHTNDWKARTYQPEFQRLNATLGAIVVVALLIALNYAW